MVGIFSRFAVGLAHQWSDPEPLLQNSSDVVISIVRESSDSRNERESFQPVDHPLEPPDKDKPVRCPLPEPCIVHDGRIWKERIVASAKKRGEHSIPRENSVPVSVHRRHHGSREHNIILPSFSAPEKTIAKMLEESSEH